MKQFFFAILGTTILFSISCNSKFKEDLVQINTPYGEIVLKLYDNTPKHKQNFLNLVKAHYYDSVLFHRVIKTFMIQGGDPTSKTAKPGQPLGEGDTTYKIPMEIDPRYCHKRGALAAARESDDVNPNKESSALQFYIVQGKVFTNEELNAVEVKVELRTKQYILLNVLRKSKNADSVMLMKGIERRDTAIIGKIIRKYNNAVEAEYLRTKPFKIGEAQRKTYTTAGGAPHLDGSYTVFGEVIKGMEVVDKISAAQTDSLNRPLKDIRISMTLVKK